MQCSLKARSQCRNGLLDVFNESNRGSAAIFIQQRNAYKVVFKFHKAIGTAHWNRYVEFFQRPQKLESVKRLIFPQQPPGYALKKKSKEWKWVLPKNIASATTNEEVLEAWRYYRYKRVQHSFYYMLILKRLSEIGGCEINDYRFITIWKRFHRHARFCINLPRAVMYLGRLNAADAVESLIQYLYKQYYLYNTTQLSWICTALAQTNLHDKKLFLQIAPLVCESVTSLDPSNATLVNFIWSYNACKVHHYLLIQTCARELQRRATAPSVKTAVKLNDADPDKEDDELIVEEVPTAVVATPQPAPLLRELVIAAEAMAGIKFADFQFFEMVTFKVICRLKARSTRP
eukprot:GHVL01032792.1.p1 GENE.GHVL01032792.1~~GHVL01032792.1.p1  ORF type:complete len:363 (+),score=34.74 GHVL01032792.1:52-1089(+)